MTARPIITRAILETDRARRALDGEPGMRAAQARGQLVAALEMLREADRFLASAASSTLEAVRSDADELPGRPR